MNDIEREIREMLLNKSDRAPHLDEPPKRVLRRARGRQVTNSIAMASIVAILAGATIVGAKSLGTNKVVPATKVPWTDQGETGPSPKGPCGRGDVVFTARPAMSIGASDFDNGPTGVLFFKPSSWKTNCAINSLPSTLRGIDDRGRTMALPITDVSAANFRTNTTTVWGSSLSAVFFRWTSYCGPATSSVRLEIELADGSVLSSPYARGAPACHGGKSAFKLFTEGGASQDPTETRIPLPAEFRLKLTAPAAVMRGTTLRYHVAFTNRTAGDVPLDPCPLYGQTLTGNGIAQPPESAYALNCSGADDVIPKGKTLSFEIRLDVPETFTPGTYELRWTFATLAPPLTARVRVV
jgi:hypothetical protein